MASSTLLPSVEGTVEELVHAHSMESGLGKRKRAGRPTVGGRGAIWDQLQQAFINTDSTRTKNGLPGVPYTVKHALTRLKGVWSNYGPNVQPGMAPTDWCWLVDYTIDIVSAVKRDLDAANDAQSLFLSLADAVRVLRVSGLGGGSTFTLAAPAAESAYKDAAASCEIVSLQPVPALLSNYIGWQDWLRVRDYVEKLMKNANSPENARLLGWTRYVLSLLLPPIEDSTAVPVHVLYPGVSDSLTVFDVNMQECSITVKEGVKAIIVPPSVQAALQWAVTTRDASSKRERLLPRRLTTDSLLSRVSRGLLKGILKGKDLSIRCCEAAWTTHAFSATLDALDKDTARLDVRSEGKRIDVLRLLGQGLYPSTVVSAPALRFPDDDVLVADLL